MLAVSVVIISYNRPDEIRRNISELLYELNPEVEVVVVDNNSEIPVRSVLAEAA